MKNNITKKKKGFYNLESISITQFSNSFFSFKPFTKYRIKSRFSFYLFEENQRITNRRAIKSEIKQNVENHPEPISVKNEFDGKKQKSHQIEKTFEVERRFRNFYQIYKILLSFPKPSVLSMPEKNCIRFLDFDVVSKRRNGFELLLKEISKEKNIYVRKLLFTFLTVEEKDYSIVFSKFPTGEIYLNSNVKFPLNNYFQSVPNLNIENYISFSERIKEGILMINKNQAASSSSSCFFNTPFSISECGSFNLSHICLFDKISISPDSFFKFSHILSTESEEESYSEFKKNRERERNIFEKLKIEELYEKVGEINSTYGIGKRETESMDYSFDINSIRNENKIKIRNEINQMYGKMKKGIFKIKEIFENHLSKLSKFESVFEVLNKNLSSISYQLELFFDEDKNPLFIKGRSELLPKIINEFSISNDTEVESEVSENDRGNNNENSNVNDERSNENNKAKRSIINLVTLFFEQYKVVSSLKKQCLDIKENILKFLKRMNGSKILEDDFKTYKEIIYKAEILISKHNNSLLRTEKENERRKIIKNIEGLKNVITASETLMVSFVFLFQTHMEIDLFEHHSVFETAINTFITKMKTSLEEWKVILQYTKDSFLKNKIIVTKEEVDKIYRDINRSKIFLFESTFKSF